MQKINKLRLWIFAIAAAVVVLPMLSTTKADEERIRKANYVYLEAASRLASDDVSAFYDLINRACQLDPDNATIAYYAGYATLLRGHAPKDSIDMALSKMDAFFQEHPECFYENFIYARVCGQVGHTDDMIRVLETLIEGNPNHASMMRMMLADAYAGKGRLKDAIDALSEVEKTDGMSNDISAKKIGYMLAMNDTTAVLNEGQRVLEKTGNGLFGNILMGEVYMRLGNPDSALVSYDKALAIEPGNGYINLAKANIYREQGDADNYEREIRRALLNKDTDIDMKVDILTRYIGKTLQDNDSTTNIDQICNTVIELHPHEPAVRRLYADYLTFVHNYEGAAEQLSFALDGDPSDVKLWQRLMWLYNYQKAYDKTLETGDRALTYFPESSDIYHIKANALNLAGRFSEALEMDSIALTKINDQSSASRANIFTHMAACYEQLGQLDEAYKCFDRALEDAPDDILALNNYAYTLSTHGGDLDRAESMVKMALAGEPENSSYLDTYAWILFLRHDYKPALEYIEKAINAAEEAEEEELTDELLEHYGDILFMNGQPEKALDCWRKALELNPQSELLRKKVDHKTYFYE
ncbi:MAG: tetratricopeptide repeat protein [Bacteroidales bacterium]|nr:tetratricopeptide repeat protein [Bacteroidales bacterium]